MRNNATIHCRAEIGLDAPSVAVEVHISTGLPQFNLVGLPEKAVRESRERVRSALINSHFKFPSDRRITANLSPADLPKHGGRYDLAVAIGILTAMGELSEHQVDGVEFVAELGLAGHIRPVGRVLSAALAASHAERRLCLSAGDLAEASLVRAVSLLAADDLPTLVGALKRGELSQPSTDTQRRGLPVGDAHDQSLDLAQVRGQPFARRALEVAAAGRLNLLMVGPPGSGKTMLASRLPGILPAMSEHDALETARIHSIGSGCVDPEHWRQRPFRAPHHSASAVALIGGGSTARPGEVSMAHNGVLFLDELPEFSRHSLDQLREPLESGEVFIARAAHRARYPARCQLVAAMNPCPCGWHGDPSGRCRCSLERVEQYRSRVSGPLLDRMDLQIDVPAVPPAALLEPGKPGESSDVVRARIELARAFAERRTSAGGNSSGSMPRLDDFEPAALKLLRLSGERLRLSARSHHRIMGVARVLADLHQRTAVAAEHVAEAISFRCLDRPVGND